jgi:hypothetical protein
MSGIAERLAAPFDPRDVHWKAQTVKGNRALAVAYLDARNIMDRLDEAVGIENWRDSYEVLPDGSVVCTLELCLDGQWVEKSDVGSLSEQPDAGDRLKAAFSDALKRAAVKFGVGRYLYSLPAVWVDYDPAKKQLVGVPQLPDWARPKGKPAPQPQPKADPSQVSFWAREVVEKLKAALSRDVGVELWREVDAREKAGQLSQPDKAAIDAEFREFGVRFPKPAKV